MAEITLNNIIDAIKSVPKTNIVTYLDEFVDNKVGTYQSYSKMYRRGFVFKQFPNLKEMFDYIDEVTNSNVSMQNWADRTLKDNNNTFEKFNNNINTTNPKLIETQNVVSSLITNIKSYVNIGGLYEKDRIIASQDKRGFFDFSLASQGLYRPIEFYSSLLKEEIESGKIDNPFKALGLTDGVVSPDKVEKLNEIFIYRGVGKSYQCERRQRGSTKVFNEFSDICYLGNTTEGVIVPKNKSNDKIFNGKDKIRLKYASSNKKSYLIFKKKKDSTKYVDIFCAYNFTRAKNGVRVLSIIPALLVAGALEEYGIQVRISILRLGSDNDVSTTISIPLKEYNESLMLAFDRITNVIGEKESGQSVLGFLKGVIQTTTNQAPKIDSKSTAFGSIAYWEESYMVDMMQRYKNWASANKDQPFINSKVANPNFQFGIPTMVQNERGIRNQFKGEIGDVLTYDDILLNLPSIIFKFYYYMDFLAIEMLDMAEFTNQIVTRYVNDKNFREFFELPNDKNELKDIIRRYIRGILTEKYFKITGGEYADNEEQKTEKDNSFDSKIKVLNESLNTIL